MCCWDKRLDSYRNSVGPFLTDQDCVLGNIGGVLPNLGGNDSFAVISIIRISVAMAAGDVRGILSDIGSHEGWAKGAELNSTSPFIAVIDGEARFIPMIEANAGFVIRIATLTNA